MHPYCIRLLTESLPCFSDRRRCTPSLLFTLYSFCICIVRNASAHTSSSIFCRIWLEDARTNSSYPSSRGPAQGQLHMLCARVLACPAIVQCDITTDRYWIAERVMVQSLDYNRQRSLRRSLRGWIGPFHQSCTAGGQRKKSRACGWRDVRAASNSGAKSGS